MNEYAKIQDNDQLYRDSKTQAIVNTSDSAFEKRKQQKQFVQKQNSQLDRIENDIRQIKSMLQTIIKAGI